MKKVTSIAVVVFLLSAVQVSKADLVYQLEVFTNNGSFAGSSEIDLSFKVVTNDDQLDFIFYNDSTINSTVSMICFDDAGLLVFEGVTNAIVTDFMSNFGYHNMPGGGLLTEPFETDFSFRACPPPPKNGIEPGEHVTISFSSSFGNDADDILDALNSRDIRIGAHLINLPDGSSESVINVPEPGSILLLGVGGFLLKRKQKYICR